MVKFSWLGSQKFEETLEMIHGDMSVEYVLRNLRPNIRKGIIAITSGEAVDPIPRSAVVEPDRDRDRATAQPREVKTAEKCLNLRGFGFCFLPRAWFAVFTKSQPRP